MESNSGTEINSSVLGTQKYWDDIYSTEIENFADHGDVGEIWFGEQSAKRIIKWLLTSEYVSKTDDIVDIGCGNGMLLIELCKSGFSSLTGLDYSENAILLAKSIKDSEGCDIDFKVSSILDEGMLESQFKVALDKGTFDAVSLDPEDGRTKRQQYIMNVHKLLKKAGLLLITSCNWTEVEIAEQFSQYFNVVEVLLAPKFTFGGGSGSAVSTTVLRRK